jgi:hypothetical protein
LRRPGTWRRLVSIGVVGVVASVSGCGGDDGGQSDTGFVADISAAVDAVEAERGPGQEYFEVTAGPQFTNVFVAVEDATAAIPYVYRDGQLEPPAPKLSGASGFTFTAAAAAVDDTILTTILDELPEATVETLSIEGGEGDAVRYVVTARSPEGGVLEVTVARDGAVLAVDPV